MRIVINTIETERDYERALEEVGRLVEQDPSDGTPEAARLDVLGTLVEAYEEKHYPIPPPKPIDAILFRLEQQGLDESDLVDIIGSRARVWEVLNGRRDLTLPMIRRLHKELGIPAEALIG